MESSLIWLVKLVFAHLCSDFLFQKTVWLQHIDIHKFKSRYIYIHGVIIAAVAMCFIGFDYWKTVVFITFIHMIIDLYVKNQTASFGKFALNQLFNVTVIAICWMVNFNLLPSHYNLLQFYHYHPFWIYSFSIFFLTLPASVIIGKATSQWVIAPGLRNAGKYIGMIERVLICLFVFRGNYEAIGLLITGKSILRYNSNTEEVKTEYLLIGTLLSIFLATIVGLFLKYAI